MGSAFDFVITYFVIRGGHHHHGVEEGGLWFDHCWAILVLVALVKAVAVWDVKSPDEDLS
jgi:hypothetical protein